MSSGNGFVARGEQLGGGAHPALGTWLRAALAAAALLAALGCASEPASESPRPAATPTPTPREEAPVTKLDVTLEKFELRAPYESEAKTWEPGSPGELHLWVKNEGQVLMNYPSAVLEASDEGLVITDSLQILYGIGDSTRLTWTLRSTEGLAKGTKLRASLRVYAYNEDQAAGKDPVGRGEISLEVGQSFAK